MSTWDSIYVILRLYTCRPQTARQYSRCESAGVVGDLALGLLRRLFKKMGTSDCCISKTWFAPSTEPLFSQVKAFRRPEEVEGYLAHTSQFWKKKRGSGGWPCPGPSQECSSRRLGHRLIIANMPISNARATNISVIEVPGTHHNSGEAFMEALPWACQFSFESGRWPCPGPSQECSSRRLGHLPNIAYLSTLDSSKLDIYLALTLLFMMHPKLTYITV